MMCRPIVVAVLLAGWNLAALAVAGPLDISSGFNKDAWIGPAEYRHLADVDMDYAEVYGTVFDSTSYYTISHKHLFVGRTGATDADALLNQYALPTDWWHNRLDRPMATGIGGTPYDGVITGADRDYHIASVGGNSTLPGNWLAVSDPTTEVNRPNVVTVEAAHNLSHYQTPASTSVLPVAQQDEYTDVNFLLTAHSRADLARNMAIYALYGDGSDEELLYMFDTAEGGSGPVSNGSATPGFSSAFTSTLWYDTASGGTNHPGSVGEGADLNMYEFSAPLALDSSKTLYGFRFEDSNPGLAWNERGLTVFAASATVFQEPQIAAPEPGSLLLLGSGLAGLGLARRRRRR